MENGIQAQKLLIATPFIAYPNRVNPNIMSILPYFLTCECAS